MFTEIAVAVGLTALIVFPALAYGIMQVFSKRRTKRPDPTRPSHTSRNIPGGTNRND